MTGRGSRHLCRRGRFAAHEEDAQDDLPAATSTGRPCDRAPLTNGSDPVRRTTFTFARVQALFARNAPPYPRVQRPLLVQGSKFQGPPTKQCLRTGLISSRNPGGGRPSLTTPETDLSEYRMKTISRSNGTKGATSLT